MFTTHHFIIVSWLMVAIFFFSCNDGVNQGKQGMSSNTCFINSDCAGDERCVMGQCEIAETPLQIANCDGERCECLSDNDCPEQSFCDTSSRYCVLIECQFNSDCAGEDVSDPPVSTLSFA